MPSSARTIVITGGRVIDPARGIDAILDVVLGGGTVAAIGRGLARPDGALHVDATGCIVAPGFVDLHCHLRDPGQEHKETLRSGLAAAAAGGFTTVCCMPNTTPPLDSAARVANVAGRARDVSPLQVRVIGAISLGQRGKQAAPLAAMAAAGAVAFSDDGRPVWNERLMREALAASRTLSRPLTLHEEDPALAAGGALNDGAVARRLGLPGLPGVAEEAMIARDIRLLAEAGGRVHIAHVSTAGAVALLREARARGLAVSAEATPHHLTLTEDLAARPWDGRPYDTRAKVNPPLRTAADVEAVIAGLADGTIEAIATDHAPHADEDKRCGFESAAFGISVFETALASVLTPVHAGKVPLPVVVERLTAGPARLFGLDAGSLAPGARADLVVFDPAAEWTVDARAFLSRGKNTPLDGAAMRGRVMLTVAGGEIAFVDRALERAAGFGPRAEP